MEQLNKQVEIAVVGAGPCGLSVGVAARRASVECVLFDKGPVTRAITLYPTYGTFFSTAEKLELGDVPFVTSGDKPTRREALKYYRRVVDHFDLDVRQYQEVVEVYGERGDFTLRVQGRGDERDTVRARNVVVATGYFDTPNLLDVPGEELPKTTHYFTEGAPYHRQDCVVVGAGNSAAEAALALYRAGARVTLIHFLDGLDPGVKPWIMPDIESRLQKGEITPIWRSRIVEIRPRSLVVENLESGETRELANDFVFAMTGWTPDPILLREMGVPIDAETHIPEHDPSTMETSRRGVYIAGVISAGCNKTFIENGREHGAKIVRAVAEATDRSGLSSRTPRVASG